MCKQDAPRGRKKVHGPHVTGMAGLFLATTTSPTLGGNIEQKRNLKWQTKIRI